ncbi:Hpt domain-containing protein [Mesorhizobium sp. 10J20-29]|jgi:HPt (histidine-containing phosphotransfer) domain-containing protein|nr:Hpt domain-containing protein [Alphaproteobacteria bacterium]
MRVPEVPLAALNKNDAVAFQMPGGEVSDTAPARPIDLAHLARQTMGDRELEREVLSLFVDQVLSVRDQLAHADVKARKQLAHSLKGSARSVGAAAIGRCAEAIEDNPADRQAERRLSRLIDEVRDFIAAINR